MKIQGQIVHNAKKPVTIVITKRDVKRGDNKNPETCAAAQACMRDLKATEARVHVARTLLKIKGKWWRFVTPEALRKEIIAFDRGGHFEPGEYQLSTLAPSQVSALLRKRASGEKRSSTGGNPARKRRVHLTTGIRRNAHSGLER